MKQEFDQLPKESDRVYGYFRVYLELGPDRCIENVGKKVAKGRQYLQNLSKKFDWPARAHAFEQHFNEIQRKAIEQVACDRAVEWWQLHEPTRRQAWLVAEQMIADCQEAQRRWRASGRVPGFESIARMAEIAFKLKSFAAGLPTEVKEVRNTHEGKISVEWEAAIRKAYGIAPGAPILDVIEQPAPVPALPEPGKPAEEAKP
ncbi:MAG: hypothetical protein WCH99_12325 [Verrucomicrobiota bacterium]